MANGVRIEVIDLENTAGNPYLAWVVSEGTLGGGGQSGLKTDFSIKFGNQNDAYSVPILMRACGTGRIGSTGSLLNPVVQNPQLQWEVNESTGRISTWKNSPFAPLLVTNNFYSSIEPNPYTNEAAEVRNPYFGTHYARVYAESSDSNPAPNHIVGTGQRGRLELIRLQETGFQEVRVSSSGNQEAWLTYDMTSGMNNKKVFGISMEILDKVSGNDTIQLSADPYNAPKLLYYSGHLYSGRCDVISLMLSTTGSPCEFPEEESKPLTECIVSGLTPEELRKKISGVMSGLKKKYDKTGTFKGEPIDESKISTIAVNSQYVIYQGEIAYNNPIAGDKICFSPYTYDYSGEYIAKYGVNPPFSQIPTFCWTYGVNFTDIDTLIAAMNTSLYNANYYLWLKDNGCISDANMGYYENGPLLKATKSEDGLRILIESTRVGLAGKYQWIFEDADRVTIKPHQNSIKYFLPSSVTVQAKDNTGIVWNTLHVEDNIDWTQCNPIVRKNIVYDFITGSGVEPEPQEEPKEEPKISGSIEPRLVYSGKITGKNDCGDPFEKEVKFFEVPSGFSCEETGGFKEEEEEPDPTSPDNIIDQSRLVSYHFLKTGWKFSNLNEFDSYRIVLNKFVADSKAQNLEIDNSFYVNSINLYGTETGNQIQTGYICPLKATYTGRVMGYTSGVLTGVVTGMADASGMLRLNRMRITGAPNGGGLVRFQRTSGQPQGDFTGLLTAIKTGTGFFTESVQGYFYDSGNQCVSFSKDVSGNITGSGVLTGGPYAIIRDETMQTINGSQIVYGTGEALMSGEIPNFTYNFTDIPAFAYAEGTETQVLTASNSGQKVVTKTISVIPPVAYSFAITGTKQATASFTLGFPQSGNQVLINDNVIIYDPFVPENTAPTFYKNLTELNNIINSGSDIFGVTSAIDGPNKLILTAVDIGESGNGISTQTINSANGGPAFATTGTTGGQTNYQQLTPSSLFTGTQDVVLTAKGQFTGMATGYITGEIKQLDFVRDFTGVWNLSSGDIDFRETGWYNASLKKYNNSGFSPLPYYSGRPDIIPIRVSYTNSPLVVTNDAARLVITGYGLGTGISMDLSGQI